MNPDDRIPDAMADMLFAKLESVFPNTDFKKEAKICIDSLLPSIGDSGVTPKLLAISDTDTPGEYHYTFYALHIEQFNEFDVRADALIKIGQLCAKNKEHVCAVFFITEAWVSTQDEDPRKKRKFKQAGDDPNRREAAIISGMTIDKRSMIAMAELQRAKDNTVSHIGKTKVTYDLKRTGIVQPFLVEHFFRGYLEQIHNDTNPTKDPFAVLWVNPNETRH